MGGFRKASVTYHGKSFKLLRASIVLLLVLAGTWRPHDIVLTASMRRRNVASTSVRRRKDVMCLMGVLFLVVIFYRLVSWVGCGIWFYQFLIIDLFTALLHYVLSSNVLLNHLLYQPDNSQRLVFP